MRAGDPGFLQDVALAPESEMLLLIDLILDDNDTELANEVSNYDYLNGRISLRGYKLPPIISYLPTVISLSAYFQAINCFSFLLNAGASLTYSDSKHRLPSHFASAGGSMEIIRTLETNGTDFTSEDSMENQSIHYAAEFGQLDIVQWLYTKGLNVRHKNKHGDTPLHLAAYTGQMKVVKFFINKCEIPIDEQNMYNSTPLSYTCLGGHADVASFLINKGADINNLDRLKRTPVILASQSGSLSVVKLLVIAGADFKKKRRTYSPLVEAAMNGHLDIVRYLVEHGVDVNVMSSGHLTPIMAAIAGSHTRVAKFLINRGAKLDDFRDDVTPLIQLCRRGNYQLLDLLFTACGFSAEQFKYSTLDLLSNTVVSGNAETIKTLFKLGFSLKNHTIRPWHTYSMHIMEVSKLFNTALSLGGMDKAKALVKHGTTPENVNTLFPDCLLYSLVNGHAEIAEFLRKRGAVISQSNIESGAAIREVIEGKSIPCMKILLDIIGDQKDYIFSKISPVYYAMNLLKKDSNTPISEIKKIIAFFVEQGANINGCLPLISTIWEAIAMNSIPLIRTLIKYGADINEKVLDHSAFSSVHYRQMGQSMHGAMQRKVPIIFQTVNYQNKDILDFLIESGCDIKAVDAEGSNIIIEAVAKSVESEFLEYLLNLHLDVNHQDRNGTTALITACRFKKFGLVPSLLKFQANPNIVDNKNYSPLIYAARSANSLYIVQLLVQYGADVNHNSDAGETPLNNAIINLNEPVACYLLDHNAIFFPTNAQRTKLAPFLLSMTDPRLKCHFPKVRKIIIEAKTHVIHRL